MMKLNLALILILTTFLTISCEDDSPEPTHRSVEVDLQANEPYRYNTKISGDEEGASISLQAKHYEVSKITRSSSTDFSVAYEYKPALDYVGTDIVELKLAIGSDGSSSPTQFEFIQITFRISE